MSGSMELAAKGATSQRAEILRLVTEQIENAKRQIEHAKLQLDALQRLKRLLTTPDNTSHAPAPVLRIEPSVVDDEVAQLTEREREVARLVADGLSNKQIAAQMTIAQGTAEKHVSNILKKLNILSRGQIVGWAMRNGLA